MRSKPIIFMFSGQGSQAYHMGRELYEQQPCFREWLLKGDQLVQERLGVSLLAELYNPSYKPGDSFTRTLLSHPAIFLVEFGLAQTLKENGLEPDYVLGSSMGSFAALAVAGGLSFEDALLAVIEQAECLERYCQPGGMIAILNLPALFEQTPWLWRQSTLAAVNFDKHFVVSARQQQYEAIEKALQQQSMIIQSLPVSYAYHSPEIDPARNAYCDFLQGLPRQPLQIPFICCAAAAERHTMPADYLWTVARDRIRFRQTVTHLEARQGWTYIDVGPSGTLATFVKYNLSVQSASQIFSIMTPFRQDMKNLNRLLTSPIGA